MSETLKINSIFESISGEAGGFPQGTWMTGIRLQGCNLRCRYCDTEYSQEIENSLYYEMPISVILRMVRNNKHVLLTGGEPLIHSEVLDLITSLLQNGHIVQVETNGSRIIPDISGFGNLYWVVDRKGPSSGMVGEMLPLSFLFDQVKALHACGSRIYFKWVVGTDEDICFMINEVQRFVKAECFVPFLVSPVNADGALISKIVRKIREMQDQDMDLLNYLVFSVQLHKIFGLP